MMREQESSSAETKEGAGAGRGKSSEPSPSRGRSLIHLQRSAGNRAVAGMMSKRTRRTPTVIQRDLEGELKQKWPTTDVPYEEIAAGIKQLVETESTGTTPPSPGVVPQPGPQTPETGSAPRKVGATLTGAAGVAAAKKAFDDYQATLTDPNRKETQAWKDKLAKAQGAEKKSQEKEANLEIINKHGYKLTGKESDDDLADLADIFKTQDAETRKKSKDKLKEKMESESAAQKLIASGKSMSLNQRLGGRKL
jgi:hypothetical protein